MRRNSKHYVSPNKERAAVSAALFFFAFGHLGIFLAACQSPRDNLKSLTEHSYLNQEIVFLTPYYKLLGWGKNKQTTNVNIYIEGDGQAWQDPWTISEDPSPMDPVGCKLALVDARNDSVIYLGRPCQYIKDSQCTSLDWTSKRFSQRVIDTYHEVLNQIKMSWKIRSFTLHGYSGGATIALLIAAQRKDISGVITFAPLLDPDQWVAYHHYSVLMDSLSPKSFAVRLSEIPQEHYIGLEDEQVPLSTSFNYFTVVPESSFVKVHKIPQFTHHSDWPELWKSCIVRAQRRETK